MAGTDAPGQVVFRIGGSADDSPSLPRGLQRRTRDLGPGTLEDPFLPTGFVRPITSVDVSDRGRSVAAGTESELRASAGEVVALELTDGTTIYTSPERLADVLRELDPESIASDGSVSLESLETRGMQATRGTRSGVTRILSRLTRLAVGESKDAILDAAREKLGEWTKSKGPAKLTELGATWLGTKALMWAIESRLDAKPGFYRWVAAEGATTDLQAPDSAQLQRDAAAGRPLLVFVHGTASHTLGSFGDVLKVSRPYWDALSQHYDGRVYTLEHRTFSESPIDNAIALVEALPHNARIHLVTHSRGGLVGDLLCLDAEDGENATHVLASYVLDPISRQAFAGRDKRGDVSQLETAYGEQREQLKVLLKLLRERKISVERYVRVASPARGTRLVSSNLDVFLSALLTLVGMVPALATSPLYSAVKRVVLEIARNRTRPHMVPGIEAMLPESPMARFLLSAKATPETQVAVIAGDIEGGGLLKRLGVLFTDHVFFDGGNNDLVVDTDSMYHGIARAGSARALFDQGSDVSHFRYFTNAETREAMRAWLTVADTSTVSAFEAIGVTVSPRAAADGARSVGKPQREALPLLIMLPGVMGSHLVRNGTDRVWFDFLDLATGGIDKVAYGQPGIAPDEIYAPAYGALCDHLGRTHEVSTLPYDWRRPLPDLADYLAAHLKTLLANGSVDRPVRFLAHSMGGLVVRALAHRHTELWESVMKRDGSRFVMLGTPNRGSHAMVENLIGKGENVRKLAVVDTRHDMQSLLDLIGEFRGVLQLLPSPTFPDGRQQLVDYYATSDAWQRMRSEVRDFWFGDGKSALPSKGARDEARWLWDQDARHDARLEPYASKISYVCGMAPNTPFGFVTEKGRLKMLGTRRGDGTVPWDSAAIKGIGRYLYMPASHGELASTEEYFDSLLALLQHGEPGKLGTTEPLTRGADAQDLTYDAGPPIVPSEDEFSRALIGSRRRMDGGQREKPTLSVRVRAGDLRDCISPIIVGHYEQDPIAGAEALIDTGVVNGALTARQKLGLYAGPIGTVTLAFAPRDALDAATRARRGVIVTGLGAYDGSLTSSKLTDAVRTAALRYLLHSIDCDPPSAKGQVRGLELSALLLGYNSSASLSIADSVQSILRGVIQANLRFAASFGGGLTIRAVEIVELFIDTAISTGRALNAVANELNFDARLGYRIDPAPAVDVTESGRWRLEDARTMAYWPRLHIVDNDRREESSVSESLDELITAQLVAATLFDPCSSPSSEPDDEIERFLPKVDPRLPLWLRRTRGPAERLRFLFVGQRARAESVMQHRQPGLVDRLVAQQLPTRNFDPEFARALFQLLVPAEFKDLARQLERVVLVLDSYTANIPWELMVADDEPLVVRTRTIRQLASTRFRSQVRQAIGQCALVIGNPSCRGFARTFYPSDSAAKDPASLDDAAQEAEAVAQRLRQHQLQTEVAIGRDVTAAMVTKLLLKQQYRVLHIAAHGVVEQPHPEGGSRTGVVLSHGMLLTAAEIGSLESVPELVFLNCCHLGKDTSVSVAYNRLAYSVARELIDMGVRAVIAAGWPVQDHDAKLFADEFYRRLLEENATFGDAVFEARRAVYNHNPSGTTWGAYQAYGDPMWTLGSSEDGRRGRRPGGDWIPVAAEEVVDQLDQLRGRARRLSEAPSASQLEAIADKAAEILRGTPDVWRNRADVRQAVAAVYSDLGPAYYGKAIEHYRTALKSSEGIEVATVRMLEQLANLEARHGELTHDEALVQTAIRRIEAFLGVVADDPASPPQAGAAADLTPARRGLLASAYKRMAAVHARAYLGELDAAKSAVHLTAMNGALQRSLDWYGGPVRELQDEQDENAAGRIDVYTAINRCFLQALELPSEWSRVRGLADACQQAQAEGGLLDADFWAAIVRVDAQLVTMIAVGDFDVGSSKRTIDKAVASYQQELRNLRVASRAIDSVTNQFRLMARFFRAKAKAEKTAKGSTRGQRMQNIAAALALLATRLGPRRSEEPEEGDSRTEDGAAVGASGPARAKKGAATKGDAGKVSTRKPASRKPAGRKQAVRKQAGGKQAGGKQRKTRPKKKDG